MVEMITDCFGAQQWDLAETEIIFVQGVAVLVQILIPVAMSVHTWTVFRTDPPHERASVLGLEETSIRTGARGTFDK